MVMPPQSSLLVPTAVLLLFKPLEHLPLTSAKVGLGPQAENNVT